MARAVHQQRERLAGREGELGDGRVLQQQEVVSGAVGSDLAAGVEADDDFLEPVA